MNWDVRHVGFVPDADMEGASIGSIKWGLGVALYRRDSYLERLSRPEPFPPVTVTERTLPFWMITTLPRSLLLSTHPE